MEPDPAGKGITLRMNENCWFELQRLEEEDKLRVSFATIDRYMNEDIEHAILDSKDPHRRFSSTTGWRRRARRKSTRVKHFHDGAFRYAIELDFSKEGVDEQAARILDGLFFTFEEYAEGEG